MRTHLVVNHRVAVHVPVLIYRLRPRRREQQQIGAVVGSGVADGRCYDLGFADHRHGLEVEVAKLFPGGSRTSARWRSRRRRLIVLHALKRTLLDSSIAYVGPASGGTSGIFLAQAFERLGIATALVSAAARLPLRLSGCPSRRPRPARADRLRLYQPRAFPDRTDPRPARM